MFGMVKDLAFESQFVLIDTCLFSALPHREKDNQENVAFLDLKVLKEDLDHR